ncbi:hypothetical protein CKA32_001396 [Geitlerinema sp. FC II]|nr:hypothetical protein CKA32_001396 [Geitlerinema sp. FC II]
MSAKIACSSLAFQSLKGILVNFNDGAWDALTDGAVFQSLKGILVNFNRLSEPPTRSRNPCFNPSKGFW